MGLEDGPIEHLAPFNQRAKPTFPVKHQLRSLKLIRNIENSPMYDPPAVIVTLSEAATSVFVVVIAAFTGTVVISEVELAGLAAVLPIAGATAETSPTGGATPEAMVFHHG